MYYSTWPALGTNPSTWGRRSTSSSSLQLYQPFRTTRAGRVSLYRAHYIFVAPKIQYDKKKRKENSELVCSKGPLKVTTRLPLTSEESDESRYVPVQCPSQSYILWASVNTAVGTNDNDDQYTSANNFRNCAYTDEMQLVWSERSALGPNPQYCKGSFLTGSPAQWWKRGSFNASTN